MAATATPRRPLRTAVAWDERPSPRRGGAGATAPAGSDAGPLPQRGGVEQRGGATGASAPRPDDVYSGNSTTSMTGFVHPTIGASGSGASAARAVRPLIVSFLLLAVHDDIWGTPGALPSRRGKVRTRRGRRLRRRVLALPIPLLPRASCTVLLQLGTARSSLGNSEGLSPDQRYQVVHIALSDNEIIKYWSVKHLNYQHQGCMQAP